MIRAAQIDQYEVLTGDLTVFEPLQDFGTSDGARIRVSGGWVGGVPGLFWLGDGGCGGGGRGGGFHH